MFIALRKYKFAYLGGLVLLPIILSACSDESIENDKSCSAIYFDVEGIGALLNSTRSEDSNGGSAIGLKGGEKTLFLVPALTEGFPKGRDITRASVVDNSTISSFAVYASRSDSPASEVPDYMYNVEVTKTAGWSPENEYLWPGDGSLHFLSYSPFVSSLSDEGITELPSSAHPRSIKFHTPSSVANQFDLLYSIPTDASSSPCSLTFNHALSAIRFVTGAELSECTVKSITLSGIMSEGNLDLEKGTWEDIKGNNTYTLSLNKTFTASEGSQFVPSGLPITENDEIFMLLPQKLGADAEISIDIVFNGKETTLTGSISGQEWNQGTTLTYRLSANPAADSLILDVTGDFNAEYTGSEIPFSVQSTLGSGNDAQPIDWIAEFVDNNGNVIPQPSWVKNITSSGVGSTTASLTTVMNTIKFLSISEGSQKLQAAADINATTGYSIYNLSSATGSPAIENTANTYIINSPGIYSIPLVYGNGIKDGSSNTGAYTATTSNRYALKSFVNHLGNAITDPYIYNNAGCSAAVATLIWEDQLNLVQDIKLSSDGKSIVFNIPHNAIRQGNAVVAVKNSDGEILWSWQLWVTDFTPSQPSGIQTIMNKNVLSRNLGYVTSGDEIEFEACSVKIRFTQTNVPDGLEPLSKTIELTQGGTVKQTEEYNTFYEWGRKDPVWDADMGAYTAEHKELKTIPSVLLSTISDLSDLPKWGILNPDIKLSSKENKALPYNNLWNVNYSSSDNVKSIYDPSPVGYKVPLNVPFQEYSKSVTVSVSGSNFLLHSTADPAILVLPALGYIEPGDANHTGQASRAEIWYATIMANRINAGSLVATPTSAKSQTNSPFSGFSVRPVAE